MCYDWRSGKPCGMGNDAFDGVEWGGSFYILYPNELYTDSTRAGPFIWIRQLARNRMRNRLSSTFRIDFSL